MDHHRPEKRRRITPATGVEQDLPDDLLFMEVLVRLPVKLLVSFKCVCRSWRARMEAPGWSSPSMLVISRKINGDGELPESEDITFYRLRAGQALGDFEAQAELLLEKAACPPEAGGVTDVIGLPTHCDGLVAVATSTSQVFVCNPATKELVALPLGSPDVDGRVKHPSAAMGFDRWRNQYVVARYFYRRWCYDEESSGTLDYDIGHEVFTLGGDSSWSWERTVDLPHAISGTPPVYTGDAVYWACDGAETPRPSSLMRFSVRDRTFGLVPCPPDFAYEPALDHLAELDGRLCHVNNSASLTTFDVWQLADDDGTRPAQWSLRCRIDPGLDDECFGAYGFLPLWAGGGGMLVRVSDNDEMLYWCNEKSEGAEQVADLEEDPKCYVHHVVPYRETLVSVAKCNR